MPGLLAFGVEVLQGRMPSVSSGGDGRGVGLCLFKGIRSSRKIEQHLNYDVRFIWLAGGLKPDHNTIARFRKENWQEFKDLLGQSTRVCCEAGLVFLNVVSTDGKRPAYNLQASVDAQSQVLVAMDLTQAENDCGQLPSMSDGVACETGMLPELLVLQPVCKQWSWG